MLKKSLHDAVRSCLLDGTTQDIYGRDGYSHLTWFFDLRPMLLNAEHLTHIALEFWRIMGPFYPFQVAGPATSGSPLVAAILLEGHRQGHDVKGCILRKKRNKRGCQQLIEGNLSAHLSVVVVDDASNSGSELERCRVVLADAGATVKYSFVIVSFEANDHKWAEQHSIAHNYLFSTKDFGKSSSASATKRGSFEIAWTFGSPRPNLAFAVSKSTPVLADGVLHFGSDSGIFWSIAARTGHIVHMNDTLTANAKGIVSSPALHQGVLYYGDYSGVLHAQRADTGQMVWQSKDCDWIGSSPCVVPLHNKLYVGLEYRTAGGLGVYDLAHGTLMHVLPCHTQNHGSATYTPLNDLVVAGTNDGEVVCLQPSNDEVLWRRKIGGACKYPVGISEWRGIVVAGSFDGGIYILNLFTGEVMARHQTDDIVYATPLFTRDRIFYGSADCCLYVIDLTSLQLIKKIDMGEKLHCSPRLIGGNVCFGTSAGLYVELDPISLQIVASHQLPERIVTPVIGEKDRRYVSTYDGKMYCLIRE